MKQIKFISMLLLAALTLSFNACSDDDNSEEYINKPVENPKYDFNRTNAENYLKKLYYWDNAKSFDIKYISYSKTEVIYQATGNINEIYNFSATGHFDYTIRNERIWYDIIYTGEIEFSLRNNTYAVRNINMKEVYYD